MGGMTERRTAGAEGAVRPYADGGAGSRYKWIALSNTTLGVLIATINISIMLIALPDIFRGIGVDPLRPGNTSLLLWLIMSYMVVTAVLVVSFGRLGDMFGRVRMYNLGFAVFTVFSVLLSVTWMQGTSGALWLIGMRVLQGVGGAMLMANSNAILTDAFPADQRGLALGLNQVAGIAGSFIGLILGGLLGPLDWRLVFLVSVPIGVFGTVWAYLKLRDTGVRTPARLDWWGNVTFAIGLIAVLSGITYGIQPYGGQTMGWGNPAVIAAIAGGVAVLGVFCVIENRVAQPMFHLGLFRIRAFTAGNVASLLAALGRGGLMFILIIWLQGIWLPRHGYGFEETPLWAGIYMMPLTIGFLLAGPFSGWASDRFGARTFATGGMLLAAATFVALEELPVNFGYPVFAGILLVNGIAMGLFSSPNRAAIMNSLPPDQRGVGAGISTTFQNSATVLSIGIFFSLMIAGLAGSLPGALTHGLTAQGVPPTDAARVAALPPVGVLFASLLGYNPVKTLLGPQVLGHLPAHHAAYLTGRGFFPALISPPFAQGLSAAFDFAIAACLVAAVASLLRGGRYVHQCGPTAGPKAAAPAVVAAAPGGTAGPGAKHTEQAAGSEHTGHVADTEHTADFKHTEHVACTVRPEDTSRHPAPVPRPVPPPESGPPSRPQPSQPRPQPPPSPPPSPPGRGPGPPPEEPR
ncbi:MFS transporter [Streptomyces malaysiensis]|nr:MFS transporter [Streptomyces autolyticus]